MQKAFLFSFVQIFVLVWIVPQTVHAQLFIEATNAGAPVTDNLPSVGGSWNDINNDAYPDLLITGFDVSRNNRLYLNQQDGTYETQIESPFTQTPGLWGSVVGLLGDYDNDGDEDVMLCSYVDNNFQGLPLWLLVNQGAPDYNLKPDTTFTSPKGSYPGMSWVDYDLDGDLDFFAGAANSSTDLFYKNEGDGSFTRLDTLSFLKFRSGFITHSSWIDLDLDGDLDLYVANYTSPNANTFHKSMLKETGDANYFVTTPIAGLTAVNGANIGANWIDYDNDGDLDIYLNHFNAKDKLFRNDGNLIFTEITDEPMLEVVAYSNFNIWADFDNDGDLDMALTHQTGNMSKGKVYQNEAGHFTQLSNEEAGDIATASIANAQAAGAADHDLDGDMDIYISNTVNPTTGAPNFLFQNESNNENNWLKIKLKGESSNPNGYGSKVFVTALINGDTVRQMRYAAGGPTTYSFQESTVLHVGLGDAETVISVEVQWLSGIVDVCTEITPNQQLEMVEGACMISGIEEVNSEKIDFKFDNLYPNPSAQELNCSVVLYQNTPLHWQLIDIDGKVQKAGKVSLLAGKHQISIPVQALPNGWYNVELWTKHQKISKNWVKLP